MRMPNLVTLTTMALALLSPALGATPICLWVDENGRTQISDVVPAKYKTVANCTTSQQDELTPEQRRDAEQRAVNKPSSARIRAANAARVTTPTPPHPTGAASGAGVKRPVETVTETTDCRTWWRIFEESSECFGPYRTTRGGIKPEAFDNCNVVPSPELKCGPRRN